MSLRDELQALIARHTPAGDGPEAILPDLLAVLSGRGDLTETTATTRIDLDRQRRCGYAEVIFGQGKSVAALCEIFERQSAAGQDVLATRVSTEQADAVCRLFPETHWNASARTLRWMQPSSADSGTRGRVVVLTAGTSDRPVGDEALETLIWMRADAELICDVGVAGPWRFLEQLPRLTNADVVIVVAGMEGALPSVVGGWVKVPVIAVPTSVGYGSSLGGLTALLGMLNSCAANVTVVNIDAGFKAGYVAGLIARGQAGTPAG